jgi:hypothetical protein
MATKETKKQTWEITLIRERGKFLGYVEAPNPDAAIRQAIEEFQIANADQQRRLMHGARNKSDD